VRGITAARTGAVRFVVCAALLTACAVAAGPPAPDPLDQLASQFSPIGQGVIATLRANHLPSRGVTWDVSTDNAFTGDWVIQTPPATYWGQPAAAEPVASTCTGEPGCDPDFGLLACTTAGDCHDGGTCAPVAATVTAPGATPRRLCVGHSDALYDQLYGLLVAAQSSIEISSLAPPDGRFEAAIRNALARLAREGRSVHVRYLYGAIFGASLVADPRTPDQVLASLTRDVDPGSGLHVAAAYLRDGFVSWDHAKIVVVDGDVAVVGGHNWWTRHYLQAAPVHDLSMIVRGSAALDAGRFIDALWRHACNPPPTIGTLAATAGFPDPSVGCEPLSLAPPSPAGTARAIAIGRLGALGDDASDDALIALLDGARSSLRLSLQDIGPVDHGPWPDTYLRPLAAALDRGVNIELILTNPNARPDGLTAGSASYSNGWTPQDVVQQLAAFASKHPDVIGTSPFATAMCNQLRIAGLRQGADDLWPDDSTFANHAKLVVADEQTFYLGSQNWYPANLMEYGFVVDDPAATQAMLDAYFAPAWTASSRTAISGVGCP
jgi:phosphatidylserine/phosphatidylglycerophosphate/cardiolipin synthase-like enzyme